MPKNRWTAFLTHLGVCAIIYVVLLYLIVFHWYPQPYFAADGGWIGVQLITGVDLVLGPVLTLIVYRPGKPELLRDMALIVVLQTAALVWGTWLVYEQRIATVAFADGRFYTMTHDQVRAAGGRAPEILASAESRPALAFVHLPTDKEQLADFKKWHVFHGGGAALFMLGDRHEHLSPTHIPVLATSAIDLKRIAQISDPHRLGLEKFLAKHDGADSDYLFLPLVARYREPILVLRRSDLQVVDTIYIDLKSPPVRTPDGIEPKTGM